MSEAAIAIAYPEPWNRGKVLGYWLSYTLFGQVLGGAINLGLNSDRGEAGAVSYKVYLVFIVLQALGPFVALLLTPPRKAERTDGVEVKLEIYDHPLAELKEMAREFLSKNFLLLILFIGQGVYAEAVYFTYLACEQFSNLKIDLADLNSVVYGQSSSSWFFLVCHRYHN